MKLQTISRENILDNCRALVRQKGIGSVDIRTVARECSISVGSVYRFFPSKDELLLETVASVWDDILCEPDPQVLKHFDSTVEWLFRIIREGNAKYPGFLGIHGQSFSGETSGEGAARHRKSILKILDMMKDVLDNDERIVNDVFTGDLDEDSFLTTVFLSELALIQDGSKDCRTLLAMIRRILY